MAEPQPPRVRRTGLIFLASLAGHLGLLGLFATATFHVEAIAPPSAERVIPVDMVPAAPPPRPRPPARHSSPKAARPSRPAITLPPPPELAVAPPTPVDSHVLSARPPGPGLTPLASADFPAANSLEGGPAEADQAAASGGASPYPINPGYWQVTEHWPFIDRVERYCVAPQNIIRFMAAPCNHIYRCVYPVQSVSGGKVQFSGVISKKDERYDVHGGGEYSPVSLHVTIHAAGHWHIMPLVFAASLDGQFLAPDCPADAKRINQR